MKTRKSQTPDHRERWVIDDLKQFGIKINETIQKFLERHKINTIEELLDASLVHESDRVWKALQPLRGKLKSLGLNEDAYRFLIIPL